jgi:BASS family bile acid:Na+ symporter
MTLQQAAMLALQGSILMTVFSFGLRATPGDVLYVFRQPALLGRSILAMFAIMPIVALALTSAFALRPPVEIMLIALAISPVPPLLPGRQKKAGGDASFGLGLMVIIGALSIVIVPLAVHLLAQYAARPLTTSPDAIAELVLKAAIGPLAAGMACRALLPGFAARTAKPIELIATVLLGLGVLAVLAREMPAVLSVIGNGSLLAFAAFVAVGLSAGHLLGGPRADDRLVLALSTATRHPMIALTVAKANFPDEPMLGAAVLLYLLVGLLIGIPYQVWQNRRMATQ